MPFGAGEDQDLRVSFKVRADGMQLVDHGLVDGIAHLRPVQPDRQTVSRVRRPAAS